MAQQVAGIPPEIIRLVTDAMNRTGLKEQADKQPTLVMALADHICGAIQRAQRKQNIEYPLEAEVRSLYADEYAKGVAMVDAMNTYLGGALPRSEAVALALHLVNAGFSGGDLSATYTMTGIIQQMIAVIEGAYGITLAQDSVNVARFITHLRYLFVRIHQHQQLTDEPAPVMKLVEVVSGLATAAEVVEQLCELTLSWGKQPVRSHSTPGFIVNRVARPYYSEAWRALEEQVAAPEVIDAALRDGAGFPMGPLELTDLIGQDVNFAVTCSVFNAFWQERRFLPSLVQQELVIGGRLGKKSGLGVYDWRAEREAVVGLEAVSDSFSPMKVEKKSDGVTEIDDVLLIETQGETAQALAIRLARPVVVIDKMAGKVVTIAAAAVNPDSATRKAIYYLQQQGKTVLQIADYPGMLIWRTVAMIINEALDALQKGVASEQDIDTAMRLGVNYPYGPLAWGAQLGWQRILRLLENLQHHYGEERYRPCSLLRQRALLESGYES